MGSRVSAEAFLSSIVEAAIGIAGFAGIIAAVRQGRISGWPREPRLLLEMLLAASALAIMFALLPAVLAEADVSLPITWRIGSTLMLICQLVLAVLRTRQFRAAGLRTRPPLWLVAWISSLLVLQAANIVLGVSWPYLLGVFGMLGNGFFFFLRLLFSDWDNEDASA